MWQVHAGLKRISTFPKPISTFASHLRRSLLTLAIETSCDDTAVAILERDDPIDHRDVQDENPTGSHSDVHGPLRHDSTRSISGPARLLFIEKLTTPNTGLGGIHPLEALQSHQANLAKLVAKARRHLPNVESIAGSTRNLKGLRILQQSDGTAKQLPDFVSVTRGPGMLSNLNCGLDTAKGLATAWDVPLLGVHHMQAHALTPRLVHALGENYIQKEAHPEFPFLTLLVSGGHTMLLNSQGLNEHRILASTRDIAIGDALDKCGRILLPHDVRVQAKDTAFAKYLSKYAFPNPMTYTDWPIPVRRADEIAKSPNAFGWQIQAPLADTAEMAFSFTGIATSVERVFKARQELIGGLLPNKERLLLAQTALGIAFEHLASRTIIAMNSLRVAGQETKTLVVSGGVAANSFLRYFLRAILDVRGFKDVELLFPPPWLCTDNAAMVAWCGMEMFDAGYRSELDIGSVRKWSLDPAGSDGGVLGIGGWTKVGSQ